MINYRFIQGSITIAQDDKYCVFYPDGSFLCKCETEYDARMIVKAMNRSSFDVYDM